MMPFKAIAYSLSNHYSAEVNMATSCITVSLNTRHS